MPLKSFRCLSSAGRLASSAVRYLSFHPIHPPAHSVVLDLVILKCTESTRERIYQQKDCSVNHVKHAFFCLFATLPKATIQAAIAAICMEEDVFQTKTNQFIQTAGFLMIGFAAPLGSIGMDTVVPAILRSCQRTQRQFFPEEDDTPGQLQDALLGGSSVTGSFVSHDSVASVASLTPRPSNAKEARLLGQEARKEIGRLTRDSTSFMQAKYGSEIFLGDFAATSCTCPACLFLERQSIQSESNPICQRPAQEENGNWTTPASSGPSKRSLTARAEQELRTTDPDMGSDDMLKEGGGGGNGTAPSGGLLSDV